MQQISFKASDGYVLQGLWAVPVDTCKGTIILSSATGIKKEYYLNFAHYLVQNGYRILLYDYRGVGGSAPAQLRSFYASMHEWGTLDMNAALDFVVSEKKAATVIWIGHSIGAQFVGLLNRRSTVEKFIALNASTGYWKDFPFPYNLTSLALWILAAPLLTKIYGYAPMKKLGWGENLPAGVYREWRAWCLRKDHFTEFVQEHTGMPVFEDFTAPVTAIHTCDDYIANSVTVPKLLEFYPHAASRILSLNPADYGAKKIGHTGIFRKRFNNTIWPLLIEAMED